MSCSFDVRHVEAASKAEQAAEYTWKDYDNDKRFFSLFPLSRETMTEPRPFVFQRTPSPSPDQIFAPPITPIVLDSSPLTIPSLTDPPSISRPVRFSRQSSPSFCSPNGRNDTALQSPNRRVVLARNISKENKPVTPGTQTDQDRKGSRELLQGSGSFSPVKLNPRLENENGHGKAKEVPKKARRTRKTESMKSMNTLNKAIMGRVTKSSQSSQSSAKSTKDVSRSPSPEQKTTRTRENMVEDLNLEEAMRRRTDWTPTKDTLVSTIDLTQTPSTSEPVVEERFGNLVERYGYARDSSQDEDSEVLHPVPTKKRRLEVSPGITNTRSAY